MHFVLHCASPLLRDLLVRTSPLDYLHVDSYKATPPPFVVVVVTVVVVVDIGRICFTTPVYTTSMIIAIGLHHHREEGGGYPGSACEKKLDPI